ELISEENQPLSSLIKSIDPYFRSGEINSRVENIPGKLKDIEEHYSEDKVDHLDGLTIDFGSWWFNIRPSNTEPLLRLNIEANRPDIPDQKKKEVLKLIRED
ncbi:MAG TPA: phosphomannomutase/phosphoglucomutase, partial [candidate division Zixibacteria bacterium]